MTNNTAGISKVLSEEVLILAKRSFAWVSPRSSLLGYLGMHDLRTGSHDLSGV